MSVAVDDDLVDSLRVRVLSKNSFLRAIARLIVRMIPSLWTRVTGAYAGLVDLRIQGLNIRYVLGPRDPIGEILYWQGCGQWEPEVVGVFCKLAAEARGYVLDVGSNCGIYSLLACAANRENHVIAWEPVPLLHERILLNRSANGLTDRLKVRMAAVGSAASTREFYLHPDLTMGGFTDRCGLKKTITVRVERTDDVVPRDRRVGLIKVDVEGHERDALASMDRILSEDRPPVIFECLTQEAWDPLLQVFTNHGYALKALTRDGPKEVESFLSDTTNYLAVATARLE